jgi:hypothetical protein
MNTARLMGLLVIGATAGCFGETNGYEEFDRALSQDLVMGRLPQSQVQKIEIFSPAGELEWPTATQLSATEPAATFDRDSADLTLVLTSLVAATDTPIHPASAEVLILVVESLDGRRAYVRLLVGDETVYVMPLPPQGQWDVQGFPSDELRRALERLKILQGDG